MFSVEKKGEKSFLGWFHMLNKGSNFEGIRSSSKKGCWAPSGGILTLFSVFSLGGF